MVATNFGRHPDADIYASQPDLGAGLGARVLAESGDTDRFADAKARKNYAGTSPITRASGRKKIVVARHIRDRRLGDAVRQWAFCALKGSPGGRADFNALRARGIGHQAALRQVGNRLVGHPPRLPQNPHPLRRAHRLGASPEGSHLTNKNMRCLPPIRLFAVSTATAADPVSPSAGRRRAASGRQKEAPFGRG